ncbi:hypothetical protein [Aeoliella sp.]|uniref:hypothetical protein n=1 Tax=Aeoliella sp. TaxID=2795800 RepID=UPI003CCB7A64
MLAVLTSSPSAAQPPEVQFEFQQLAKSLNVCTATPHGTIQPGGDITAALQWACSHAEEHQQPVAIPAGKWLISETITLPARSGFTLLGSGWGSPDANRSHSGVRTVLKWTGEEGGTMIRHISRDVQIGNFTLDGNGKAAIGLLFDKEGRGIGTGKTIIEPLYCTRMKHGVQIGANEGTGNADTLQFRWLEGQEVSESVLHMVNKMGMSITVEFLQNVSNGKTNQVGVLVDGGGMLWVQSSLTTHRGTLLKINKDAATGKNNGFFRFSNTKADAQAKDGFTLVDSVCLSQIRLLFDGGINSSDAMRIKLAGSNFLHLSDFSSRFTSITGKSHRAWGTPAVLLDACRCWNDPKQALQGDVNLRMRDCTNWQSKWLENFDSQTAAESKDEPPAAEAQIEAQPATDS